MQAALLGATSRQDRHAYKALERFIEKEHEVYLAHPKLNFLLWNRAYSLGQFQ